MSTEHNSVVLSRCQDLVMSTSDTQASPPPPFFQRPQSSSTDVPGFSFAKPASHPKGGLRALPRKLFMNIAFEPRNLPEISQGCIQVDEPTTLGARTVNDKTSDPKATSQDASLLGSRNLSKSPQPDATSAEYFPPPPSEKEGTKPTTMDAQGNDGSFLVPESFSGSDEACLILASRTPPLTNPDKHAALHIISARPISHKLGSETVTQTLERVTQYTKPKDKDASQKRPADSNKDNPAKRQKSNSTRKSGLHQLTEDKLFELLVTRIRQREDYEAAADHVRRQTEEQNVKLRDENDDLHSELSNLDTKLRKSTAETKDAQSQLDEWRSKIRKFRVAVNDLGREHDTLRDEADKLRESASSLGQEKEKLVEENDHIRLEISRSKEIINEQRNQILDQEKRITILEEALSSSQDRERDTLGLLSDYKKRVTTLETYIQNYSLIQAKQLSTIRDDQAKLRKSIDAGFDRLTEKADDSNNSLTSTIQIALEECRSSIQSLTEQFSSGQLDVQNFAQEANQIVSRINRLSIQFADSIEGNISMNVNASKEIGDNLKTIERHLGPKSPIFERLSCTENLHETLGGHFQTLEPKLNSLHDSVTNLTGNEKQLVQSLEVLSSMLAGTRIPSGNPVLELELSKKFNENAQFQVQIHDLSSEAESLRKRLHDSENAIKSYYESNETVNGRSQMLEHETSKLRTENVALMGELESIKLEMRKELDGERMTLVDQMKVQHELQLQILQKEKRYLEEASNDLLANLSDVQYSLVEAKKLIDEQRKERDLLALEMEQQVQQLTIACCDSKTQLVAQTTEFERFQELDAASRVENTSLKEQLEQAQERIIHLEHGLSDSGKTEGLRNAPAGNIIVPFAIIEQKLSPPPTGLPLHESCDFAMLFMSDEEADRTKPLESTKEVDVPNCNPNLGNNEEITTSTTAVKRSTRSPVNKKKRKANISDIPGPLKSIETPENNQALTTDEHKDIENSASQMSKHTHKWTYSRIHSSATQLQRQQSTTTLRSAASGRSVAERRASPKGLVSASSGVPPKRKNSRGRGKGRSRSDRYNTRFITEE